MSEIIPGLLYLGALKDARNVDFMRKNKIKHVVSCGIFSNHDMVKQRRAKRQMVLSIKDNNRADVEAIAIEVYQFV